MGIADGKIQVIAAGVQALQAVLAALDQVHRIVQRHAVTSGEHKITDRLIAVLIGNFTHGKEVVGALGHLLVVDVQKAVVHPVMAEGAAVGALRLCNLVFVMGEDQVLAACMQVDGLAQVLTGHGAALNVPARTALAPGAVPGRLARLGGFPDSKICGVFFQVVIHLAAQFAVAAFQVVQVQVAQLAVTGIRLNAEVDIAVVGNVSMSGFDQVLDDLDDLTDMLGCAGAHGGGLNVQALGIFDVLGLELAGNLLHGGAVRLAFFDQFIVNIGDIGNIQHLVAKVLQIAAQRVKHDHRARIADMDIVIHRRAADVNAINARLLRDKIFLFAGHGIKNLHGQELPFPTLLVRRG